MVLADNDVEEAAKQLSDKEIKHSQARDETLSAKNSSIEMKHSQARDETLSTKNVKATEMWQDLHSHGGSSAKKMRGIRADFEVGIPDVEQEDANEDNPLLAWWPSALCS